MFEQVARGCKHVRSHAPGFMIRPLYYSAGAGIVNQQCCTVTYIHPACACVVLSTSCVTPTEIAPAAGVLLTAAVDSSQLHVVAVCCWTGRATPTKPSSQPKGGKGMGRCAASPLTLALRQNSRPAGARRREALQNKHVTWSELGACVQGGRGAATTPAGRLQLRPCCPQLQCYEVVDGCPATLAEQACFNGLHHIETRICTKTRAQWMPQHHAVMMMPCTLLPCGGRWGHASPPIPNPWCSAHSHPCRPRRPSLPVSSSSRCAYKTQTRNKNTDPAHPGSRRGAEAAQQPWPPPMPATKVGGWGGGGGWGGSRQLSRAVRTPAHTAGRAAAPASRLRHPQPPGTRPRGFQPTGPRSLLCPRKTQGGSPSDPSTPLKSQSPARNRPPCPCRWRARAWRRA